MNQQFDLQCFACFILLGISNGTGLTARYYRGTDGQSWESPAISAEVLPQECLHPK